MIFLKVLVLWFLLKSVMHCKLIFVAGVRFRSRFMFFAYRCAATPAPWNCFCDFVKNQMYAFFKKAIKDIWAIIEDIRRWTIYQNT